MAFIEQVEPDDATGEVAELYELLVSVAGAVPNIVKLSSLKPAAARAAQDLYQSVLYHDSGLTMTEKEVLSTLVSSINGCGYCVHHHGAAVDRLVGVPGTASWVAHSYRQAQVGDRAMAMLDFAAKLTERPDRMAAGDLEALRGAGLSDRDILDLVQLIAYFNYTNRLAVALGVDPEEPAD